MITLDDLTHARSARHADARVLLQHLYERRARGIATYRVFKRGEAALGMSHERLRDAGDLLWEHEFCDARGRLAFQITRRGIDAVETPAILDEHLPIRRDGPLVATPDLRDASTEVLAALRDAREAIARGEAPNAIDRVHTVLHARVRGLCDQHGIAIARDGTLPQLFAALWKGHPAGPAGHAQAERVMRSIGAALEALSEVRNNASLAHGRPLLDEADALLAINVAYTVAQYVEARFGRAVAPPRDSGR